jgi:hypothetical protein
VKRNVDGLSEAKGGGLSEAKGGLRSGSRWFPYLLTIFSCKPFARFHTFVFAVTFAISTFAGAFATFFTRRFAFSYTFFANGASAAAFFTIRCGGHEFVIYILQIFSWMLDIGWLDGWLDIGYWMERVATLTQFH